MPAAETVWDFWVELIHTLWGQYEHLQGDSDSRGVAGRPSSNGGALDLSFAFGLELFSGSTGHRRGYSPLRVCQRQLFSCLLYLGESPFAPLLYPQDVVAFGRLFL